MTQPDPQLLFFSTLLQLENQARHAKTPKELIFTVVNETVRLIKYRQAIFWQTASQPVCNAVVKLS